MIPEELKNDIVESVGKSMKFLKVLNAVKSVRGESVENSDFYKTSLSRFRRSVVPASAEIYALSFFIDKNELDGFLKELNCTWDSKNKKIILPDTH